MEDSYPKLSISPHDKSIMVFTVQFTKSKKAFYDPSKSNPPCYSFVSGGTTAFKKRKWGVNVNTKIVKWIFLIITGTAGLTALFGEMGETGSESIAQIGASF